MDKEAIRNSLPTTSAEEIIDQDKKASIFKSLKNMIRGLIGSSRKDAVEHPNRMDISSPSVGDMKIEETEESAAHTAKASSPPIEVPDNVQERINDWKNVVNSSRARYGYELRDVRNKLVHRLLVAGMEFEQVKDSLRGFPEKEIELLKERFETVSNRYQDIKKWKLTKNVASAETPVKNRHLSTNISNQISKFLENLRTTQPTDPDLIRYDFAQVNQNSEIPFLDEPETQNLRSRLRKLEPKSEGPQNSTVVKALKEDIHSEHAAPRIETTAPKEQVVDGWVKKFRSQSLLEHKPRPKNLVKPVQTDDVIYLPEPKDFAAKLKQNAYNNLISGLKRYNEKQARQELANTMVKAVVKNQPQVQEKKADLEAQNIARAVAGFKNKTGHSIDEVEKGSIRVEKLANGQAVLKYRVKGANLSHGMKFNDAELAERTAARLETQTTNRLYKGDVLISYECPKEPKINQAEYDRAVRAAAKGKLDQDRSPISMRMRWAQTLKRNAEKPVPDLRTEMGNAAYNRAANAACEALEEAGITFKEFKFANSVGANIILTRRDNYPTTVVSDFGKNTHDVARVLNNWSLQSLKDQKVHAYSGKIAPNIEP